MENKLNLITELAMSTVGEFANKRGAWPAFLQTAARSYKYPFYDQLLIYAQRPDATACAPIEIWNTRMKRWVKRGAKGIALIDHTSGAQKLRYVFDVSDTYAGRSDSAYPQLWAAKDEFRAGIIEDLAKSFGEADSKVRTFELELMSISANAVNDRYAYLRYDLVEALESSYMEDLDELNIDVICKRLIKTSVAYTVMSRCGIDVDMYFDAEDFADIRNFNTFNALTHMGDAVSEISGALLRQIERTAKELERLMHISETENKDYTLQERTGDNNGAYLHDTGRLSGTGTDAAGGN